MLLPFGTCCTFLVFGLPWSERNKTHYWTVGNNINAQKEKREALHALCQKTNLIFLRARRQALDLRTELNKHVSDGGDPGMEVFVLIVLGAEILLVPLTLLQSRYGDVHATSNHTEKHSQWWRDADVKYNIISMTYQGTGTPSCFFLHFDVDGYPFLKNFFFFFYPDSNLKNVGRIWKMMGDGKCPGWVCALALYTLNFFQMSASWFSWL